MTTTLLLRLAAPRQSWGEVGTERHRPTSRIPTFTGIHGLLGACLGLPRGHHSPHLIGLDLHVRVDRAGVAEMDFHTVSPPPNDIAIARRHGYRIRTYSTAAGRADFMVPIGKGSPWLVKQRPATHVSERHYLADAEFMLTVCGPDRQVEALGDAVHNPVFTPFLGRQAFAPAFPFHLGVREGGGLAVLESLPSTAPVGKSLPVHALTPGRPLQVARIDPPRTLHPLRDWKL